MKCCLLCDTIPEKMVARFSLLDNDSSNQWNAAKTLHSKTILRNTVIKHKTELHEVNMHKGVVKARELLGVFTGE